MDTPKVQDPAWLAAMESITGVCVPFALRTALSLHIFEILADSGPDCPLTATDILRRIPQTNPNSSVSSLDRLLRVLASHSFLTCSVPPSSSYMDNMTAGRYELAPSSRWFLKDKLTGVSLAPFCFLFTDYHVMKSWLCLSEAILEGGKTDPFKRANGKDAFLFLKEYPEMMERFNLAMSSHSALCMQAVLDAYDGFGTVRCLVDVGGGIGSTINVIISRHPNMSGINFDLPHVIASAPKYQDSQACGRRYVRECSIRRCNFIEVLHDWSDEQCLKILSNCYKALPENGKVIVIDAVLSSGFLMDGGARVPYYMDLTMLAVHPGGRERSEQQFTELAVSAGFCSSKLVCMVNEMGVLELWKSWKAST